MFPFLPNVLTFGGDKRRRILAKKSYILVKVFSAKLDDGPSSGFVLIPEGLEVVRVMASLALQKLQNCLSFEEETIRNTFGRELSSFSLIRIVGCDGKMTLLKTYKNLIHMNGSRI